MSNTKYSKKRGFWTGFLSTLGILSVGGGGLAIGYAIWCHKHAPSTSHFLIYSDNSIFISGEKGAREAINYVKDNLTIPDMLNVPNAGQYPNNGYGSPSSFTYNDIISRLTNLNNNDVFSADGVLLSDINGLFGYGEINDAVAGDTKSGILINYSNFMMWVKAIYGLAWRILNDDSTYGIIDWQNNNTLDNDYEFNETPTLLSDYWSKDENEYKTIKFFMPKSPIMPLIDSAPMPTIFDNEMQQILAVRAHLTKTNKGLNHLNCKLGRAINGEIILPIEDSAHEKINTSYWIGTSTMQTMNFNLTTLTISITENQTNNYFMLDPYMIDISKRLCQDSSFYPPTYLN